MDFNSWMIAITPPLVIAAIIGIFKIYDQVRTLNGSVGKLSERIDGHEKLDDTRFDDMLRNIEDLRKSAIGRRG